LLDKNGMLRVPTPERKQWVRISGSNNDKERYVNMVLEEIEDCESFEEFEANVQTHFSFEHDQDQGTNDFIEGGIKKFENIPNYKEVVESRKIYDALAAGAITLFKDYFN